MRFNGSARRAERLLNAQAAPGSSLSNNAAQALTLSQALRNLGQEVIVAKDNESTAEWRRVRGIVQMVPADPGSALEREQRAGCGAVLQSVQSLGKQAGNQPPQLWVVTSNSVAIRELDRCEGLSQSSVWGLVRTIRLEHPGFRCVSVDLEHETADLSRLAEELTAWDGEEEVVFREGAAIRSPARAEACAGDRAAEVDNRDARIRREPCF